MTREALDKLMEAAFYNRLEKDDAMEAIDALGDELREAWRKIDELERKLADNANGLKGGE